MCTVGLFDTLTFRQDEGASAGSSSASMSPRDGALTLTCDDATVPCDETNLVHRAARALSEHAERAAPGPRLNRGLSIHLSKHVPVGGGLGGGSSDAARTLRGLNRLWNFDLPREQLHAIGAQVGSDVPFFLHGPSAVCSGRGEIVAPARVPRARWALLVLSTSPVPTRGVYAKFDELRLGDVGFGEAQPPWQEWADLSAGPLLSRLRNDLEPAAFALVPQLGRLRDALELSLARVIRLTGSGGTLFTLFDERQEAEVAAQFVRTRHMLEALAVELAPKVVDDLGAS
jgi:4-diphosphocytidyl-2-C-methyl-D-erythritol kinase